MLNLPLSCSFKKMSALELMLLAKRREDLVKYDKLNFEFKVNFFPSGFITLSKRLAIVFHLRKSLRR